MDSKPTFHVPGFEIPETGLAEIDRQHADLIASMEKLSAWIGTKSEMSAVFSAISYLNDYVDRHFVFEERMLAECGYPHLKEHMEEHERLRQRVADLTSKILEGEEITDEIVGTMREWLIGHIGEEDVEYARHLKTAEKSPVEA